MTHEELQAAVRNANAKDLGDRIEREAIQQVKDAKHIGIGQLSRLVHERIYGASRKHARNVIEQLVDKGIFVIDVNMELVLK